MNIQTTRYQTIAFSKDQEGWPFLTKTPAGDRQSPRCKGCRSN
ncbi:hypothetical protein NC652_023395 [Populus alba x Populus x berolinensis]|nr:hypothetical protein NC652_023395 [Populus alba x Populus x berolinensis]